MSEDGDSGRAAAICEHCGSCHVVRIRSDGSIRVIGTNGSCGCGGSDYRILGPDHPAGAEADPAPEGQAGH